MRECKVFYLSCTNDSSGVTVADCKKCDNSLESFQMDETPKLLVNGREVGIHALDDIMKDVRSRGLPEEELGKALLDEVKRRDYVPSSVEKHYLPALLGEYKRRYG